MSVCFRKLGFKYGDEHIVEEKKREKKYYCNRLKGPVEGSYCKETK